MLTDAEKTAIAERATYWSANGLGRIDDEGRQHL